jgi:hypothetical protein
MYIATVFCQKRDYDSTLDIVIVAGVVLEKGNAAPVAGLISIFRTVSFGTGATRKLIST